MVGSFLRPVRTRSHVRSQPLKRGTKRSEGIHPEYEGIHPECEWGNTPRISKVFLFRHSEIPQGTANANQDILHRITCPFCPEEFVWVIFWVYVLTALSYSDLSLCICVLTSLDICVLVGRTRRIVSVCKNYKQIQFVHSTNIEKVFFVACF